MIKFKTCRKCGGEGDYPVTREVVGGGLMGWRQSCERCEGTGQQPYDTWTKPTLAFIALVVAYFVWQIFLRH